MTGISSLLALVWANGIRGMWRTEPET